MFISFSANTGLHAPGLGPPALNAKVVKANSPSTPINRRYLIEMSGKLPAGVDPMSGVDYQPIH